MSRNGIFTMMVKDALTTIVRLSSKKKAPEGRGFFVFDA